MTQEQITQALKSSKSLQVYDIPNLTSFEDYTPEKLENMTYIYINPDDQNWQPGYEKEIPQEADPYKIGALFIGTNIYPIYIY